MHRRLRVCQKAACAKAVRATLVALLQSITAYEVQVYVRSQVIVSLSAVCQSLSNIVHEAQHVSVR